MPATINGIGTTYYGKSNLDVHVGICQHCGQRVNLESYETRLWFVILFIPIIPLGKKEILDYCPSCSRHRFMPLDEWNRIKGEAIRKSTQEASKNPDDPATAVQMLNTLIGYRQRAEAEQMADYMAGRFRDDAAVQYHVGCYYEQIHRPEHAGPCFLRAFELSPSDANTRRAAAVTYMQMDEPGKAWVLMMEPPGLGAAEDAAVLHSLAKALVKARDFDKANRVLKATAEKYPAVLKDKSFEKTVKECEGAAPPEKSLLPTKPLWKRPAVIGAGIAAAVALAAMLINALLAWNQKVYVTNGMTTPLSISIDGASPREIKPLSHIETRLAEGKHRATVTRAGAKEESVEFEIINDLGQRWSANGTFILNPLGAGTIFWEQASYSAHPDPRHVNPVQVDILRAFVAYRDIDFPFEKFPERVSLKEREGYTTRTRVGMLSVPPADVLSWLYDKRPKGELVAYAEMHIRLNPYDTEMISSYTDLCGDEAGVARCRDFLRPLLAARPVVVEAHRSYQECCKLTGVDEDLCRAYADMSAAEPKDSMLLYLAGRVAAKEKDAMDLYDRSIAADAKNPYPYVAKAYHHFVHGDAARAKEALDAGARAAPGDFRIKALSFDVRMALGDYANLATEVDAAVKAAPLDLGVFEQRMAVLVMQRRFTDAKAALDDYLAAAKKQGLKDDATAVVSARYLYLKTAGWFSDIPAFLDHAKGYTGEHGCRVAQAIADADEKALDRLTASSLPSTRGEHYLLLAASFIAHKDAAGADRCRDRAAEMLSHGSRDNRVMAKLMKTAGDVPMEDVDDLAVETSIRAAMLAVLARDHALQRAELLRRAAALYIPPVGPKKMIADAIAAVKG